MRKLRLVKPWQLQARRQKAILDGRMTDDAACIDRVSCKGPSDEASNKPRRQQGMLFTAEPASFHPFTNADNPRG